MPQLAPAPGEPDFADRIHGILWLTGALFLIGLVLGLVSQSAPVADTALSDTWQEVQSFVQFATSESQVGALRASLACDFLFLLGYAALFVWTASLAGGKRAVIKLAILTAIFDCAENIGVLFTLVQLPVIEESRSGLIFTRAASIGKWTLVALTAIGTGLLWIQTIHRLSHRRWLARLTSVAFAAGGVCCLAGLAHSALFTYGGALIAAAFLLQLAALAQVGSALRLLYITRMPLLILTFTAALGPLALGPASALLGGLFNLEGDAWGLTLVALVAGLTGCAAIAQTNLILYYGRVRMGDPGYRFLNPHAHPWLTFATGIAPAMLLMGCAAAISENIAVPLKVISCAAGLICAALLAMSAKVIQLKFTDRETTIPPPPYLLFVPRPGWPLARYLQKIYDSDPPAWIRKVKALWQSNTIGWSWLGAGRGYFTGQPRRLLSGHSFAIALASFSVLLYLGIGLGKRYFNLGGPQQVPSLVFVLLAVLAASWLLSGLAFFLDRFRFPVFVGAVMLALLTGLNSSRDHIFEVRPPVAVPLARPVDVLRITTERGVPVVIAAAGGGIQASAWTARVLEGLHARDSEFGRRVALVSSISGGSVGAMFYGAKLRQNDIRGLYEAAAKSSLDEVAWGLMMPDVGRVVLPFWPWPKIDRGWALEQTWIDRVQPGFLSEWSADTLSGKLPAFLINSTAVEKGQLISFATTHLPSREYNGKQVTVRYDKLLKDFDLSVATAARMSATFPYVTPAAAPEGAQVNSYHLVDGGYYDNYGLIGLTQWLDDALEGMQKEGKLPQRIAVLKIRAFPNDVERSPTRWGWLRQIVAPAGAFLNVRSYAQWEGANSQLELLRDKWRRSSVEIDSFDIQFPEGDPPLSWKLTRRQKLAVEEAWADAGIQREVDRLLAVSTPGR